NSFGRYSDCRLEWRSPSTSLLECSDDLADGRHITRERLRFCGFCVDTATHGMAALEKAHAVVPDAVLLDLMLPDMDGFEVVAGEPLVPATLAQLLVIEFKHRRGDR